MKYKVGEKIAVKERGEEAVYVVKKVITEQGKYLAKNENGLRPVYDHNINHEKTETLQHVERTNLEREYDELQRVPNEHEGVSRNSSNVKGKKNLEWLKDRVNQSSVYTDTDWYVYEDEYVVSRELVINLINQVEKSNQSDSTGLELPVIPSYVADRIIEYKKDGTYDILRMLNRSDRRINHLQADSADFWIDNNQVKFVLAYSIGYTVEKEYCVYLGDGQYLVSKDELVSQPVTIRHEEDKGFLNYKKKFTEQEIKGYMGGVYWPFAKLAKKTRDGREKDCQA